MIVLLPAILLSFVPVSLHSLLRKKGRGERVQRTSLLLLPRAACAQSCCCLLTTHRVAAFDPRLQRASSSPDSSSAYLCSPKQEKFNVEREKLKQRKAAEARQGPAKAGAAASGPGTLGAAAAQKKPGLASAASSASSVYSNDADFERETSSATKPGGGGGAHGTAAGSQADQDAFRRKLETERAEWVSNAPSLCPVSDMDASLVSL